jgi:hypothetical protein
MNAMISLLCLVKLGCFDVERNAFLMVHVQCDREKRREEEKMIPAIPPVYI